MNVRPTSRVFCFALLLSAAPYQCSKGYDPALRREDTAGDGLWALAEDFRTRGDARGREQTLRFLVARYPSSRRATKARDELEQLGVASPSAATSPAAVPPSAAMSPATASPSAAAPPAVAPR
ncbi:MAG: hypothetical protein MUF34_09625 [Polyangiaceae bacterium]|nr:hypothetical protein [Polyangiaceae bacterium]